MSRVLPVGLLAAGVLVLLYAADQGDVSVHFVVIVPIVSGEGLLPLVGMLLIMAGIVAWLFTSARGSLGLDAGAYNPERPEGGRPDTRIERRSGAVGLIGPIPVAWGSDRQGLLLALILVLAIVVVMAVVLWLLRS